MDDMKSVRCRACDKLFASVWYEDKQVWEELCWDCLDAAFFEQDDVQEDINDYLEERGFTTFSDNG